MFTMIQSSVKLTVHAFDTRESCHWVPCLAVLKTLEASEYNQYTEPDEVKNRQWKKNES